MVAGIEVNQHLHNSSISSSSLRGVVTPKAEQADADGKAAASAGLNARQAATPSKQAEDMHAH